MSKPRRPRVVSRLALGGLAMTLVFLYSPAGVWGAPTRQGYGIAAAAPAGGAARGENQIEEFDIVGKIYKPEVFVFLGRKALNLSWDLDDPRFKRSFLDAVLNSVWGPPF